MKRTATTFTPREIQERIRAGTARHLTFRPGDYPRALSYAARYGVPEDIGYMVAELGYRVTDPEWDAVMGAIRTNRANNAACLIEYGARDMSTADRLKMLDMAFQTGNTNTIAVLATKLRVEIFRFVERAFMFNHTDALRWLPGHHDLLEPGIVTLDDTEYLCDLSVNSKVPVFEALDVISRLGPGISVRALLISGVAYNKVEAFRWVLTQYDREQLPLPTLRDFTRLYQVLAEHNKKEVPEMLDLAIQLGLDPNGRPDGRDPITFFCKRLSRERADVMAEVLLRHGASVPQPKTGAFNLPAVQRWLAGGVIPPLKDLAAREFVQLTGKDRWRACITVFGCPPPMEIPTLEHAEKWVDDRNMFEKKRA